MESISVIVPAYNAASNIYRCVSSILLNGLSLSTVNIGLQIVVVNDGSTDNTFDILNANFKDDARVLILDQENQGVAVAREHALSHVKGNYVAFCDSDDWVDEDWLISMYRVLKEQNADIVTFKAKINGVSATYNPKETLVLNREQAIKEFLKHKKLNGILWTKLFNAKLFEGIHFDSQLACFEDADVMWKILHKTDKLVIVNDAKYNWMISRTSLSNGKTNRARLESSIRLFSKMSDDAQSSGETEYSSLVDIMCRRWFYGGIKEMYKHNVFCSDVESVMLKTLRNHPLKTIKTQERLFDRFFILLLTIAPPILTEWYIN